MAGFGFGGGADAPPGQNPALRANRDHALTRDPTEALCNTAGIWYNF